MTMKFSKLELKNFKSYRDETCIQWMKASAIFGPNGVGKSALVDAIEFAFTFQKYNKSSVKLLEDICNDSAQSTWVKITLNFEEETKVFRRTVFYDKSSQEYMVNNSVVNLKEYRKQLLECDIDYRANNFLVQQNSIENIATKGAKERCELFEFLSGSNALKKDYEKLSKETNQYCSEVKSLKSELKAQYNLKKNIIKSSKLMKKKDDLQQKLDNTKSTWHMIKFFEIERSIEEMHNKIKDLEKKVTAATKLKRETEQEIDKLEKQLDKSKNLLKKSSEDLDSQLIQSFELSELKQKLSIYKDKINKTKSNLDKAKKKDDSRKENIIKLKEQYKKVKEKKDDLEKQFQSVSSQVENEQYEAYLKLKSESQKKLIEVLGEKLNSHDSISRELESLKDEKEDFEKYLAVLNQKKDTKIKEIEKIDLDLEKVEENIEKCESDEKEIKEKIKEFKSKIENLKESEIDLLDQIKNVTQQIGELKLNKKEEAKAKRKEEILERLKRFLPAQVIDRVSNLCDLGLDAEPDYIIAITKIMGNKMNNIIVKDTETAKKCIQYLRSQYLGDKFAAVETFLPLDYLPSGSSENTRKLIENEPDVILAIDVMSFLPNELKALLHHHIFKDILICNSDEKASDLSKKKKLDCVSLNGTFYRKDGIISGGLASLIEKSKQFHEKTYIDLKFQQEKLINQLAQMQKEIKKEEQFYCNLESKLKIVDGFKDGKPYQFLPPTKIKIKFLEDQRKELENKKKKLEKEVSELVSEIHKKVKTLHDKRFDEKIDELKKKYDKLEREKNEIEDKVFRNFCQRYNIADIRVYEKKDLQLIEENKNHVEDFNSHLIKIKNEIKYEKERDTETEINKLEKSFDKLIKEKEKIELDLTDLHEEINNKKNKISSIEKNCKEIKKVIEEIEKNLEIEKFKRNSMTQDLKKWSSTITNIRTRIINYLTEKHNLLSKCKIDKIDIPLCNGTIEKIVPKSLAQILDSESGNSSQHSGESSQLQEKDVEIDFSTLDKSIKKLKTDGFEAYLKSLNDKQITIEKELEEINSNFKCSQNLEDIENKIKKLTSDLENKSSEHNSINKKFAKIKAERLKLFEEFFKSVETKIDNIFKTLYNDNAAQAYITSRNPEEPYLEGIDFGVIIPTKKFITIENLSGGEKTMAAVALMLAIYSVKPAPFLIFDEIDAALDLPNINKLVEFFSQLKLSIQIIFISHHNEYFFKCADAAIGISIDSERNASYVLHIDLNKYQKATIREKALLNTVNDKLNQLELEKR